MVFETRLSPIEGYVPLSYVQKSLRHRIVWPKIPRLTDSFVWNCIPYHKDESQTFQYSQLIKLYYSDDVTSELPDVTPASITPVSSATMPRITDDMLLSDDVSGEKGTLGVCVWKESDPTDKRIYGTPWTSDSPLHGGEYTRVGQGTCMWGFDEETRKITAPPGYRTSFYTVPPSSNAVESFSDEDIVIAGRGNPVPIPAVDRLTFGRRFIIDYNNFGVYSDEIYTNNTPQISDPFSGGRFDIVTRSTDTAVRGGAIGSFYGASLTTDWINGNVFGVSKFDEGSLIFKGVMEAPGAIFVLDRANTEVPSNINAIFSNPPWSENIIPLFPVSTSSGYKLIPCYCISEGNREFSIHPDPVFEWDFFYEEALEMYYANFSEKFCMVQVPPLTSIPPSYPFDAARTEELFNAPPIPELMVPAESAWHREFEYNWADEAKANGAIGVLCYLGGDPEDDSRWIYKTIDTLVNDTYNGSIRCRSFWFIWRELQVNTDFQILAPASR